MEWIIIVFGVLYVVSLIWNVLTDNANGRFYSAFLLTMLGIIFFILLSLYGSRNIPTALDVYRGKTTLEYKVVDDVKVDSVVIFKNDNYGKD